MSLKWNFLVALRSGIIQAMTFVKYDAFMARREHPFASKLFRKYRLYRIKQMMKTSHVKLVADYDRIKLSLCSNEAEWLLSDLPQSDRFESLLKRLG